MREFIKFVSILVLCVVTFLIFVNVIERTTDNGKDVRKIELRSDKKLLNLENFEYTIHPSSSCNSTLLTWIVTSYAGDPSPRSALRRAYTSEELASLGIKRIFLLGMLDEDGAKKTGVVQGAIRNEADRFDDVLQGNFYEAYRNLTYKHLMGLKWATENCINSSIIMKQDDDIIINLYEVIDRLKSLGSRENIFAGYVLRNMRAVREPANKWFVTEDEFKGEEYPDFLSGWLYLVSRETARKLVEKSYACKHYFWIDDVFVTGILRKELNVDLIDWHGFYTTDYRFLRCCIRGKEKNLKCEFFTGPNGGKNELQIDFQDFAEHCRTKCSRRPIELSVGKTCVVEDEKAKVETGSARIEPIQFI